MYGMGYYQELGESIIKNAKTIVDATEGLEGDDPYEFDWLEMEFDHAPTIIEADKAESEEV